MSRGEFVYLLVVAGRGMILLLTVLVLGLFFSVEFPTVAIVIAIGAIVATGVSFRRATGDDRRLARIGLSLSVFLLVETIAVVVLTTV